MSSQANPQDDAPALESEPAALTLGFIPLVDCAPLVVAKEKGFAADEGLSLRLVRETSWANIRDRVMIGHFDAAHMLGPMPIASTPIARVPVASGSADAALSSAALLIAAPPAASHYR